MPDGTLRHGIELDRCVSLVALACPGIDLAFDYHTLTFRNRIYRPGQVAYEMRSFQQLQEEEKSAREAERVRPRAYLLTPAHARNLHNHVHVCVSCACIASPPYSRQDKCTTLYSDIAHGTQTAKRVNAIINWVSHDVGAGLSSLSDSVLSALLKAVFCDIMSLPLVLSP